jgi:hypothetical protein
MPQGVKLIRKTTLSAEKAVCVKTKEVIKSDVRVIIVLSE